MKCNNKIEKKFTFQWQLNKFCLKKQMAQVCHLPQNKKCIP